ncbi:DUF2894 domain-containing protein [Spongiibacter taiwanensis]|uniref:DUF2894 domain-containing protein n=1 Tax=Spongiibacter taiwanensis TaxID=1748242 RepID=UPI002036533C|nr:DUF2894 domain-containing protein [Spongiibacter taiwanensis]USA44460.1 DUF2894 domain-containing protein [Spongiibacter taiwanensis]
MSKLDSLARELDALADSGAAAMDILAYAQAQDLVRRARARRDGVAERLLPRLSDLIDQLKTCCHRELVERAGGGEEASPWQGVLEQLNASDGPLEGDAPACSFEGQLRRQESEIFGGAEVLSATAPPEGDNGLRAAHQLRRYQRQRQRQDRIAHSLRQRPENPGPLNPQMLAVKALTLMGSLSTSYTNRFVSYIETLANLEGGAEPARRGKSSSKAAAGSRARKRKS